jgi:hypothetical protein
VIITDMDDAWKHRLSTCVYGDMEGFGGWRTPLVFIEVLFSSTISNTMRSFGDK